MQNKEYARKEEMQFYIVIRQILNTDLKEMRKMATKLIRERLFLAEGRGSKQILRMSSFCSRNTTEAKVAGTDSVKERV